MNENTANTKVVSEVTEDEFEEAWQEHLREELERAQAARDELRSLGCQKTVEWLTQSNEHERETGDLTLAAKPLLSMDSVMEIMAYRDAYTLGDYLIDCCHGTLVDGIFQSKGFRVAACISETALRHYLFYLANFLFDECDGWAFADQILELVKRRIALPTPWEPSTAGWSKGCPPCRDEDVLFSSRETIRWVDL